MNMSKLNNSIPWDLILTRIGLIVISVMALYVALQALSWNYITKTEFLYVLWAILGAWGIGAAGGGIFKLGDRAGYQRGYAKGLTVGLEIERTRK